MPRPGGRASDRHFLAVRPDDLRTRGAGGLLDEEDGLHDVPSGHPPDRLGSLSFDGRATSAHPLGYAAHAIGAHMPEVSRFFGIVVTMFYNDHPPPHFHVRYGEQRGIVGTPPLE